MLRFRIQETLVGSIVHARIADQENTVACPYTKGADLLPEQRHEATLALGEALMGAAAAGLAAARAAPLSPELTAAEAWTCTGLFIPAQLDCWLTVYQCTQLPVHTGRVLHRQA